MEGWIEVSKRNRRPKKKDENKVLYVAFASILICLFIITALFMWNVPYRVGYRLPLDMTGIWVGRSNGIKVYLNDEFQEKVELDYDVRTILYSSLSYESLQEIKLQTVTETDTGRFLMEYTARLPTYEAYNTKIRELFGLPPMPLESPSHHLLTNAGLWKVMRQVTGEVDP
jgi:hypothetical protein